MSRAACVARLGAAWVAFLFVGPFILQSSVLAVNGPPTTTHQGNRVPRTGTRVTLGSTAGDLRGPRAISVVPSVDPQDLLQCLLGPDVSVSNVVLSAAPGAAGTFSGGLDIVGIGSGIVLSSGNIATIVGPNLYDDATTDNAFPGDPDLDALIPGYQTFDAAFLEFDFECDTSQVISFQYVFASEEYNEWVDSLYNDVFGFFLNGVNIAAVPAGCSDAGIPVSINNVNCGNPYAPPVGLNCNCFRNNDLDDGGPFFDTEMDGLTQVFYATATIQPGVNHIKIAIADAGDPVLDSNVMIDCQSFTCGEAPPTGACCFPNGTCVTLSYTDCYDQGGDYYGDYIPCLPDPCNEPVGACCFPNGECEVEGRNGCELNGGIYLGDGVPCTPDTCFTISVGDEPGSAPELSVRAAPSPSAEQVLVQYRLPVASFVTVEIFDSTGRLVRSLHDGPSAAGDHSLTWNGRGDAGTELPAGVYFIRVESAAGAATGRAILLR